MSASAGDGPKGEGDIYWKLVEPVWDSISIYDGPERFLREYARAPEKSKVLFAAHWAQSEVLNGGLGQFFDIPTGVLAPEAVDAFRAIGMPECSSILAAAMRFFGETYPRETELRQDVFEEFYERYGEEAIPLREQEDAMAGAIEEENGGFWVAADRYADRG